MYERLILSVLIDSDWSDSASFSEGTLLPERNDDETMQYIWKNAIYHFESYMEAFCESKEKVCWIYSARIFRICVIGLRKRPIVCIV